MVSVEDEDLILMHLEGLEEFRDEEEVPYSLTPRGITEAVGIRESEPYTTLEEMETKGLIEDDVRDIAGLNRKRNVYFLADEGKNREKVFWKDIKDKKITLRTEECTKEMRIKDIKNQIDGRNPILRGLRDIDENNVIDITDLDNGFEVFVGRKEELELLKDLLKSVKKTGVKTVFIEGKAGIGKTSLASKLKPFAEELGFQFLSGACQTEISDPYLPFKEAFTEYIEGETKKSQGKSMAFIGTRSEEVVEDKNLFDAKKKETFYETTNFIKRLAKDNPLVIFLDDLQWVDRATLDILLYMEHKLGDAPVFFIGAYRSEEVSEDHHLVELIHRLNLAGKVNKLELKPFSPEYTEKAVKSLLGKENVPKRFINKLHEKTEGNPLFIKESLKQMLDEGIIDIEKGKYPERKDDVSVSELVHDVIDRRVNRLDDETIKIIEIGSVIGKEVSFDLLTKTSNIDEIDLLDHTDMLLGHQLWNEDTEDEVFHFSHDLIQETVYKGIKGLKKKLLHQRVANNIEELYENEIENWYSDLARHHHAGKDHSKALDYYLKAGERAKEMYAHEDAIEMYEKSLQPVKKVQNPETTKMEIWENLADTCKTLGKYEKSRKYLDKLSEQQEDLASSLRAYRKKSTTWLEQGQWEKALDCVETALDMTRSKDAVKEEIIKLLANKGWAEMRLGKHETALEIFQKEKDMSEKLDDDGLIAKSFHDLGTLNYTMGDYESATSYLERAIESREDSGNIQDLSSSLNNLGLVKMYEAKWDVAEELFEKCRNTYEKMGDSKGLSIALNNLGDIHRERGEMDKALDYFNKSLDIVDKIADEQGSAGCLTNIGITHHMKGDLDEALSYYARSLEKFKTIGTKTRIGWVQRYMADTFTGKGRWDEAFEAYEKARDIFEEIGEEEEKINTIASMTEAYIMSEDIEKAEELSQTIIENWEDLTSKILEGKCRRVLGVLYREKDEFEKAEDEFLSSKEVFKKRSPTDYPKILYELGVLYHQKGAKDRAEENLVKAQKMFEEFEMKWWKKRTDDYLQVL
ncbi:MAG: tetratricopeptide repeat protein [Candidatus Saliniplasma sp.]